MRKNWAAAVIVGTTLALAAAVAGLAARSPTEMSAAVACTVNSQPGPGRIHPGETDFGTGNYIFRVRGDSRAVIHLPAAAVAVWRHPVNIRLEAGRYLVETDRMLLFECYHGQVGETGRAVVFSTSAPYFWVSPVTLTEQQLRGKEKWG